MSLIIFRVFQSSLKLAASDRDKNYEANVIYHGRRIFFRGGIKEVREVLKKMNEPSSRAATSDIRR